MKQTEFCIKTLCFVFHEQIHFYIVQILSLNILYDINSKLEDWWVKCVPEVGIRAQTTMRDVTEPYVIATTDLIGTD
jgi:hypothetical protein